MEVKQVSQYSRAIPTAELPIVQLVHLPVVEPHVQVIAEVALVQLLLPRLVLQLQGPVPLQELEVINL